MSYQRAEISIATHGKGLIPITREIERALANLRVTDPAQPGLLHIFMQHTSASLLIQENASPSAQEDLEEFITRLAPEGLSWYRHLEEGPDDTPSHMRSAVTPTFLSIPTSGTRMLLGTWQGIFLWEHRQDPRRRNLVLTLMN